MFIIRFIGYPGNYTKLFGLRMEEVKKCFFYFLRIAEVEIIINTCKVHSVKRNGERYLNT